MNLSLVKSGALLCIMAQNPYKMGYEGMKSAAKVLAGEKLSPAYVDTGVSVITKDNLPK
jgi:ribose transport system substrate-binding protein